MMRHRLPVVPARIRRGYNGREVGANDVVVDLRSRDWRYPEVGPWIIDQTMSVCAPRGVLPSVALAAVEQMRAAAKSGLGYEVPEGWTWNWQ